MALVGLVVLVETAGSKPWAMMAAVIYGVSLVGLFTASAFYHTALCSEEHAERLVRFDYTAIFLLIAGTYTPICILGIKGGWGMGILIAEWSMAAVGIVWSFSAKECPPLVRVGMYIVMGWLVTLALGPTLRGLTGREVGWLAAGGAIYTLGAVVYATKRPDLWRGRFESHDLWHSMVLAAAGCHYLTVQSLVSAT